MSEPELRRAQTRDIDGLRSCLEAAYAKAAETIDDLPDMAAGLADSFSEMMVWVVEADGRIVGALFFT